MSQVFVYAFGLGRMGFGGEEGKETVAGISKYTPPSEWQGGAWILLK